MRIKMNNATIETEKQHEQQKYVGKAQTAQTLESTDDDEEEESCSTATTITTATTIAPATSGNSNNNRNLEFAQKLGYSEHLIHTALTRLGAEAKQNELLAELIKLSADAPKAHAPPMSIANLYHNNSNYNINTNTTNHIIGNLRHIVIDGSNVALSHGNNELFSCRGIRICVDWFRQRGHKEITAFVPNWRKETSSRTLGNNNIIDQDILYELERERVLVFTPSRLLDGKRVACYDDRYILKLAAETDGIVVSNDNYRDLLLENTEFRKVVQERLLMYSFVNDRFMPPDDPLGRSGPTLDVFLRMQSQKNVDAGLQLCPYGKKCTYGVKCKFRHQPAHPLLQRMPLTASLSAPLNFNNNGVNKLTAPTAREPLNRTKSNTIEQVCQALPNTSYNMTAANGNSLASNISEHQLNAAFNYQLELHASEEINRHKKLQRQVPAPHQQQQQQQHRLLVPTISAPLHATTAHNANNVNRHLHLTRIPSAPVAPAAESNLSMPVHNYAFLSASDSRINEELHSAQSREEKRRLLRFHLSSLFPQHQVHAVLQMYPDETDAKTICAAIINLFPHN